ncbi:cadherin-like protein 26 isoform X2 [Xiphophorus hellerii]|uniref:cadherin-like protein 26 isoform X2 n=1 Tax=Xiphophorus hellerii TaxID=8084 RepID=UPI0013B374C4|nr:cadherin-like protein 26 isoform X2 [Xiphophorus hellerii]
MDTSHSPSYSPCPATKAHICTWVNIHFSFWCEEHCVVISIIRSNMEIKVLCLLMILSLGIHLSPAEFLLRQKRNWIIQTFMIDESYSGTFPYYLGKIEIDSSLNIVEVTGQGMTEEPRDLISLSEKEGHVIIKGPVDYEKYTILKLIIRAQSKKNHTWTKVGVNFEIIDANDNPPIFSKTAYEITINESTLQGTELINVTATDSDIKEEYRIFFFSIESVIPETEDLEFTINKVPYFGDGTISFKGCLDYKKADKYTIIVKATDLGKPKPLFSFTNVTVNINHGNRYRPMFTNQTGPVRVKEGEENVIFSRLQVKDEDTKGTKGWNAIYEIHGDKNNNFKIRTDPQTNKGLLYVNKPLDYEDESLKNITITVENEIPYFTCKVMDRNTSGLWKIKTDPSFFSGVSMSRRSDGGGTHQMTIVVEDVNEPPVFDELKPISLPKNVEVGHYLGTIVSRDPDVQGIRIIRYSKGEDPANLVSVDPETGKITTASILDRESPYAKDGIYVITVNAVDCGSPPQTSTASLSIYIARENDNAPSLIVNTFDMCQSDKSSWVNVTAEDPDEDPYSGPFSFKLLGDVKKKWRIDPEQGYSVNLVKGQNVYSGHHKLKLEVSDFQGNKALHDLSVVVCKCSDTTKPDCSLRKAAGFTVGTGALGVLFFCITLIIGLLFLTFLVSCKPETIPVDDGEHVQHLMKSNTEEPGTDCHVPFNSLNSRNYGQQIQVSEDVNLSMTPVLLDSVVNVQGCPNVIKFNQDRSFREHWDKSTEGMGIRRQLGTLKEGARMEQTHETLLFTALTNMLEKLEAPGEELGDYEPTVYDDEGDLVKNFELDAISNPEDPFDSEIELDSRFSPLASVCSPDLFAQSTKM